MAPSAEWPVLWHYERATGSPRIAAATTTQDNRATHRPSGGHHSKAMLDNSAESFVMRDGIVTVPRAACVYCGRRATTRDHVPPRSLLERPFPANLPTVPCCERCNRGYSLDEQYFLVLLGQIGTSKTIAAKVALGGVIDRALTRAPALDERLLRALESDDEDGRVLIRPEIERVRRVIAKIALGLFVLRYGRVPAIDSVRPVGAYPYSVEEQRPTPYFIATLTERFRSKRWRHIQHGVFSYIFVRDPQSSSRVWCIMDFHQTLWGIAHLPNPKSVRVRNERQLWLLPD